LRIEDYFQEIRQAIESCPVVQSFNIRFDKRGTYEGFIRGEVYLVDGSTLHLREFVDVELNVERLTYVYQYMASTKQLIFRYDNTGHHRKLNLATPRLQSPGLPSPSSTWRFPRPSGRWVKEKSWATGVLRTP
jgi:hypothetical protein